MKNSKKYLIVCFLFIQGLLTAQNSEIDHAKIKEDMNLMIDNIEKYYAYLEEKRVNLNCLKQTYSAMIKDVNSEEQSVLFFESLINEFYDSHLNLGTHRPASYRIYAPVYAEYQNGQTFIKNVWQSQIEPIPVSLIDAEVLEINGRNFQKEIDEFPTYCNDKNDPEIRTWIGNKVIAGQRNQPRVLKLKLKNNTTTLLDINELKILDDKSLLNYSKSGEYGIIRINNSLGNSDLIKAFDDALDNLLDTKGLIIDLRNTVDGGDSYVARAIMSRFIDTAQPYQKHSGFEIYGNHEPIEKYWIEYVIPRGKTYNKPVVILAGRWTGSMGEGLAIGFEGMGRGQIVGTAMHRLAGAIYSFSYKHRDYNYRISREKLYHINGTPREKYVPKHKIVQTTNSEDVFMETALKLMN